MESLPLKTSSGKIITPVRVWESKKQRLALLETEGKYELRIQTEDENSEYDTWVSIPLPLEHNLETIILELVDRFWSAEKICDEFQKKYDNLRADLNLI